VRLGLDTLTIAEHPDLVTRLQSLARDERVGVRCDVLERLAHVDAPAAAEAARHGLHHVNPEVRATSVRTLGATGVPTDLSVITPCLTDASWDVQVAAVVAVSRIGDDAARRHVAARIDMLSRAESPDDLVLAARMLAGSDSGDVIDRRSLRGMLGSGDHAVINAALAAIRLPDDRALLADAVAHLDDRSTAGAAVDALVRSGAAGLDLADDVLSGRVRLGQHGHEQLARVCRMIGGSSAEAVLSRHAGHRDREVGLAVLTALAALGAAEVGATDAVIRADLEHATRVLHALVVIEPITSAGVLRSALWDEGELLRQRILAGLAIRYGAEELGRIGFQLAQKSPRVHALALEWLEVTLVGIHRAAVALLEPDLTADRRLGILTRWFPVTPSTPQSILLSLAEDLDDRWRRPWITACALLVAADVEGFDLEVMTRTANHRYAADDGDDRGQIVRETIAGIDRRQIVRHA
jgi:HEAT repeat protein